MPKTPKIEVGGAVKEPAGEIKKKMFPPKRHRSKRSVGIPPPMRRPLKLRVMFSRRSFFLNLANQDLFDVTHRIFKGIIYLIAQSRFQFRNSILNM